MTELDLYKFCQGKEIDWRGKELILWVDFCDLKELAELIGYAHLSEGGMEVALLAGCVGFALNDLCDNYDIDPENILKKGES